MNKNLEDLLVGNEPCIFKSGGEQKIADFLDANSIKYRYESPLLVNSINNRPRIWYPDFYLPEFKTFIEYFGLVGNINYDSGVKEKESVYAKMGMDVIPVYPWMFSENWQKYIMDELKRTTCRQHRNLMAKQFWSQPP